MVIAIVVKLSQSIDNVRLTDSTITLVICVKLKALNGFRKYCNGAHH